MRWIFLALMVLVACSREESTAAKEYTKGMKDGSAPGSVAQESVPKSPVTPATQDSAPDEATVPPCDENAAVEVKLGSEWIYGGEPGKGPGSARIQQRGSCVQVSATWSPVGEGPHYSIEGTLQGRTVPSAWQSLGDDGTTGTVTFEVSEDGSSMRVARTSGKPGSQGVHWLRAGVGPPARWTRQ